MRRISRESLLSHGADSAQYGLCARKAAASLVVVAGIALLACAAWSATPEARRQSNQPHPPAQDAAPAKPGAQPSKEPDAAAKPQRLPVDVDPEKMQPYNLPPASRQRMRLCGERWRDLKMAGKSAGLTWRSFAEKCLPGQD